MNDGRIKVLFIAGEYRSGSTIIGNILGQIDGFFFTSELRDIWEKGIIDNNLCGCGLPFGECEIWQSVLSHAFPKPHQSLARQMMLTRRSGFRSRHIPLAIISRSKKVKFMRIMAEYIKNLGKLYGSIQYVTGCKLIIDSSNTVSHAYFLSMIDSIDLYVLHLIRDARGVAFSWRRRKKRLDSNQYMMQRTPLKSSLMWLSTNIICEMFTHTSLVNCMRLKYEDFAVNPKEAILGILSFIGEEYKIRGFPFFGNRSVVLKRTHGIWGNPNRHKAGEISIYFDDEWKQKMDFQDRFLVSVVAAPLLFRYGYFGN